MGTQADKDALERWLTTHPTPTTGTPTTPPTTPPTNTVVPPSNLPPSLPAGTDPRDPTWTSSNAPRVQQNANGQWTLTEHGNTRNLQGDEVAQAKAYADQFWKDNPTGWQMNNPWTVPDAYKQVLGRDPDAAGLAAHANNPGGTAGVLNTILNSEEAKTRRAAPITSIMSGGAGTGTGTTAPTTPTAPFQGFTPKYAMEGINVGREQNIQKSAKDAYAYFANNAPEPPPGTDKAALQAWFKKYIEPGMNSLGHKVNSVNGDTFNYSNWEGTFDVDWYRGAGAPGGALAWQVQPTTAKMSGGAYTPRAATTPAAAPTVTLPATTPPATPPPSSTAGAGLQAQIDALIAGKDPLEEEALLASLRP